MILPMGGKHAPLADTVLRPLRLPPEVFEALPAAPNRLPGPGHRVNLPSSRLPTAEGVDSQDPARTIPIERPFSDP
jgi:hypothetical protein